MKKLLSLILSATLLLSLLAVVVGCAKPDDHVTKIAYLSGSTGVGMAKMISDNSENASYEFIGDFTAPTTLLPELMTPDCDIDIAALPTQAAAQLYNKTNGRYKVVCINTLGVLYIATNGVEISNLNDLVGKTVYIPEVAPGYVLEYVLEQNGIPVKKSANDGISASEAVTFDTQYNLDSLPGMLASGNAQIGLLPEPKLTATQITAVSKGNTVKAAIDLTKEWNKVSDNELVQGCIVASTDYIKSHEGLLKKFLSEYEGSIEYMDNSDNLENAASLAVATGILPKLPIAKQAIPRCNIDFIDGSDMKECLSAYLQILKEKNPTIIGGKLPDDAFYYNGNAS